MKADRDNGATFTRAFHVLEAVINADRPQTASEICSRVGLPKATMHRLAKMLIDQRLLQYELDGRHLVAGPRLFAFAGMVMSESTIDLGRHTILEALVNQIGETCNISIPQGTRMVYAERVETHWPLSIQFQAGTKIPLHCSASGKLYLSQLARPALDVMLERMELGRLAKRTIVDRTKLKRELACTRERGYSLDNGEFVEGLIAIAVPIKGPSGRFCAGLAMHAPEFRMSTDNAIEQLPALQEAAGQIEKLMKGTDEHQV